MFGFIGKIFRRLSNDLSHDFSGVVRGIKNTKIGSSLLPKTYPLVNKIKIFLDDIKKKTTTAYDSYSYNSQIGAPLLTACLTSSFSYMLAEGIYQAYSSVFNPSRIVALGVHGLFVGGPMYHYWFSSLDRIAVNVLSKETKIVSWINSKLQDHYKNYIKVTDKNGEILDPSNYHVYIDRNGKGNEMMIKKYIKIGLDQLIFSSTYTLVLLTSIPFLTNTPFHFTSFFTIYALDCVVWPILQYYNFSRVPPHMLTLAVSLENIVWNTIVVALLGAH